MQTQLMATISSTLLNYVWTSSSFKKKNMGTLLDPINTAVALCLLNHYGDGTKISIQNNEINFQEQGTMQGISRWSSGDKFEDLHNLINPIKKLLEKKNVANLWGDDNKNFNYLCYSMQSGLSKLAETYKDNLIANHTLEFYKSLINDSLQNKQNFLEQLNTENDMVKGNYDIYQEFFEDWTKEEINVLVVLLENLGLEQKKEVKDAYKDSIHRIILGQNTRIKNIINKVQSGMV